MAGAKLEQAKKALAFCVENLNDSDHFELLRFATEVEPLFNNLRDATKENRSAAQKFIETLKPIGGTAIDDALKKAVALRPENGTRPYVIVFLTDGRPTVGTIDENQIIESATKSKTGLTRIFNFGIGTDVNTHLLDRIAEETKAFSQYVFPEEDIEVKVSAFFTKIKEPVLASPTIKFPDGVRVTKIYPSPVPDIFKSEQLIIAGRYAASGDGAVQIEGSVSGESKKFAYESPEDVLQALAGLSSAVGATADIGHFASCGHDTVDAVRKLAPRLKLVHLKDVEAAGGEVNVLLGKGIAKVPEVMRELHRQNFSGLIAIEYEKEGNVSQDVKADVEFARRLS